VAIRSLIRIVMRDLPPLGLWCVAPRYRSMRLRRVHPELGGMEQSSMALPSTSGACPEIRIVGVSHYHSAPLQRNRLVFKTTSITPSQFTFRPHSRVLSRDYPIRTMPSSPVRIPPPSPPNTPLMSMLSVRHLHLVPLILLRAPAQALPIHRGQLPPPLLPPSREISHPRHRPSLNRLHRYHLPSNIVHDLRRIARRGLRTDLPHPFWVGIRGIGPTLQRLARAPLRLSATPKSWCRYRSPFRRA